MIFPKLTHLVLIPLRKAVNADLKLLYNKFPFK